MADTEIIGGIKFYTKDILEIKITDTDFNVILMDGTSVTYTMQPEERQAEIVAKDVGRIEFLGLINATIKDSPNNDVYILSGCENITVDADSGIMKMDGEDIGTDQDLIELKNRILDNGVLQYSKSNILKLNKGDLYKLPNESSINYVSNDSDLINE